MSASDGTKFRMKVAVMITQFKSNEEIMTPQGPAKRDLSSEVVEAVSEGYSRGRCLDEIMEDSPVGIIFNRIRQEQKEARGVLEN